MANNELAIRFTEEQYASKSDVARELKMSLIDTIWSYILSYRNNFNQYLNIRSIEHSKLILCMCTSINALINGIDAKIIKIISAKKDLSPTNGDTRYFRLATFIDSLNFINDKYNAGLSKEDLKNLVTGSFTPNDKNQIVANYFECLKFVEERYVNSIDVDYLAHLYSLLAGKNCGDNLFRTKEDAAPENRMIIDRVYTCAPAQLIDQMMSQLFDFIASNTVSSSVKAIAVYYYINYVKPFTNYNDEIATLVAKSILCHDSFDTVGLYLPLEEFLTKDPAEISKHFVNVQKTADLTYFLSYAGKIIDEYCSKLLDTLANFSAIQLKLDFFKVDEPLTKEDNIEPSINEVSNESAVEVKADKVDERKIIKEDKKPVFVNKKVDEVVTNSSIAISSLPPVLDEKEAIRLEEHLLELEPLMKKNEAKFYARHCTLGKIYTIAQFKKSIGCVYETARTSMEHLVELGYYEKQQIKNKFVYKPVIRK